MKYESTPSRKTTTPIKVCCTPEERQTLIEKARQCGLPVSNFLRSVGLGLGVVSVLDHNKIDDLVRVNGDLGRLGGLLKRCLNANDLVLSASRRDCHDQVEETLSAIKSNQAHIQGIIKQVVKR